MSAIDHLPPRFRVDHARNIFGETFTGSPKQDGADNHAHTPERVNAPLVYSNCTFDANGASEALKLSRHWHVAFLNCIIIGGVEDGLDVVRGGDTWFVNCEFVRGRAKRDVTIKGGARDIHFIHCQGLNKLTLGDYTKYDHHAVYYGGRRVNAGPFRFARPPVRNVQITGGSPVVEVFHAQAPIGAGCRVNRPAKFLGKDWTSVYFYFRALMKEKKPAPLEEFVLDPREL